MMVAWTMVVAVEEVRSGWILDMFLKESHQYFLTSRCSIRREVKDDSKILGVYTWKDEAATEGDGELRGETVFRKR